MSARRNELPARPEVRRNELPAVVRLLYAVRLAKLGDVDNEVRKSDVLPSGLVKVLARDGEDT